MIVHWHRGRPENCRELVSLVDSTHSRNDRSPRDGLQLDFAFHVAEPEFDGKQKLLDSLKRASPGSISTYWAHYVFRGNKRPINLDAVLADADLT
jgi:hypothetical protein